MAPKPEDSEEQTLGRQLANLMAAATQLTALRPGVSAELRRRNLFGTALNGGVGGRYEENNWAVRGALNIPTSVWWSALRSGPRLVGQQWVSVPGRRRRPARRA